MSDANKDSAAARDSEPFLVLAATKPVRRPFWRRWLAGILVLGLVAGGALGMQFGLFGPHKPSGSQTLSVNGTKATSADGTPAGQPAGAAGTPSGEASLADNLAGLALQGISLFNGEKGAELWRLKASWAHLSQEGDTILVDAPVVRYTMGDPAANDFLDVKSEKGKVTDNQRYLTLTGNVDVKRFGDTVTGPRLDYDSKTRVMVFPEGAELESERATGQADVFTWDLESNVMVAEGRVNVLLKPQAAPPAAEPTVPPVVAPEVKAPVPAAKAAASKGAVSEEAAAKTAPAKKNAPKVSGKTTTKTAPKASTKKQTSGTAKQTSTKPSSKTTPAPTGTTKKSTTTAKSAS